MADLSQLSDADLEAIASGDMSKVSEAALMALAGERPKKAGPIPRNPRTGLPDTRDLSPERFGKAVDMITEAGLPTAGQAAGGIIGGVIGGGAGNSLAQLRRVAFNEQDEFNPGQAVGAAMVGGIPGGPAAKSIWGAIKGALLQAGGNVAAKAAETAIDEGRAPSGGEVAQAGIAAALGELVPRTATKMPNHLNATERSTLSAAMQRGLKVSPSEIDPSYWNRLKNSLGGNAATRQRAQQLNEVRGNELSAEQLGLPSQAALTDDAIKQRVTDFSQPMAAIDKHSPQANAALGLVRDARDAEREAWKTYNRNPTNQGKLEARKASEDAEAAEQLLEQSIPPELFRDYVQARKNVAQAMDVRDALNPTDSNVDMRQFGNAAVDRRPQSGNIAVMGDFAGSKIGGRYVGQPASTPQVSGVSPAVGAAAVGDESGGLLKAGAAGLVQPMRDFFINSQLSDKAQKEALERLMGTRIRDFQFEAIRRAILNEGREGDVASQLEAAMAGGR